jgi:AcrR family transcriptional regulator
MSEDLRTRKSKLAIKKAFIKLVNEQDFVNVTVKEIAEEAQINRQTFYNYYQDKYDLTERLNEEQLNFFEQILQVRLYQIQNEISLSKFYKSDLYQELQNRREEIIALLSIKYDQNSFSDRLRTMFMNEVVAKMGPEGTAFEQNLFSAMFIDLIKYLMKNPTEPTPNDVKHLRYLLDKVLR